MALKKGMQKNKKTEEAQKLMKKLEQDGAMLKDPRPPRHRAISPN